MNEILMGLFGLVWMIAGAIYVWHFKPWKTLIFLLIDFAIITMAMTDGNILGTLVSTPLFAFSAVIPFHKGFVSVRGVFETIPHSFSP